MNPERVTAFIAQAGHESGNFSVIRENLNYSAQGLLATFPHYFNQALAAKYARNPSAIANHVYANRMGNGDEASGDGWKFRGRGLIQLTGRSNYSAFASVVNKSIADVIPYLETPEGATEGAGWFWSTNGLNELADAGQFITITKKINGGTNGLADREAIWATARTII